MTNQNQNPAGGCGCGNHADKPVDPQHAEVREEIKLVPAEGSVDNVVAPADGATCGCGEGQCNCGHGEHADHGGHGAHATGKDQHNADIDGAVRTVDEAEHHRPDSAWNDGNIPTDDREATASGQGNSESGNVN